MFLTPFDRARESTTARKKYRPDQSKKNESGQTVFIVAVTLVVVLGMAALAVDVTFFYAAYSQAQKAADAAALPGAKAFVSTGFTSGQLGDPASGGCSKPSIQGWLSPMCGPSTASYDVVPSEVRCLPRGKPEFLRTWFSHENACVGSIDGVAHSGQPCRVLATIEPVDTLP